MPCNTLQRTPSSLLLALGLSTPKDGSLSARQEAIEPFKPVLDHKGHEDVMAEHPVQFHQALEQSQKLFMHIIVPCVSPGVDLYPEITQMALQHKSGATR